MRFSEQHIRTVHIREPRLEFGYGQQDLHPKTGITLYGPARGTPKPDIRIGVIGTPEGLQHFRVWANRVQGMIDIPERTSKDKAQRPHLSPFPGIEETFGLRYAEDTFVEYNIHQAEIIRTIGLANKHEAVAATVALYTSKVESHQLEEETTVDMWFFVINEIIFRHCRPASKRTGVALSPGDFAKSQKRPSFLPLLEDIIDLSGETIFDDTPDFHRQVKARMLSLQAPTQIVRETTLHPEAFVNENGYALRPIQDAATTAWNLATGMYYKTQPHPPWHVADMRPDVCYIGLVFKQIPNDSRQYSCCAAQMFLNEGDGVVFRGANGPWKTSDYEHHLSFEEAGNLIKKVLKAYHARFNRNPKELFIHGRAEFNDQEWAAFREAAPEGTNIITVRITKTSGDMKLFRDEGDYPCIRGTALLLTATTGYLWASGYVPRIDSYLGPETPNPLQVRVLRHTGEKPDLELVMADILGLTKINYNACNYGDGLPVTIRFAEKVGEVLVNKSARDAARQPFKFYI